VMVQAYRLLVNQLDAQGLQPYPLHLGVTEAGEGEDGRIKSAEGIGLLLEDGLGDTIRVSLTEDPEFEIPVAKILADRYSARKDHALIAPLESIAKDPFVYAKRESNELFTIGNENVPRVIADFSSFEKIEIKDLSSIGHFYLPEPDKWTMTDTGADFIYTGSNPAEFMLPNGLKEIVDYDAWLKTENREEKFPLLGFGQSGVSEWHPELNFISVQADQLEEDVFTFLKEQPTFTVVLETKNNHGLADQRRFFLELLTRRCKNPVIIKRSYAGVSSEEFICYSSTDLGGLLIDGFGDGVWIAYQGQKRGDVDEKKLVNRTAFGILQAARTRTTKTEYISCPSCGRTLFDLQKTTAMIRKRTDHLKGIKIGIMGCIVNGPGEMADADYGYVGSGVGKITLYKGKEVIKRGVPSDNAVDELIEIIKNDGRWMDPSVA